MGVRSELCCQGTNSGRRKILWVGGRKKLWVFKAGGNRGVVGIEEGLHRPAGSGGACDAWGRAAVGEGSGGGGQCFLRRTSTFL